MSGACAFLGVFINFVENYQFHSFYMIGKVTREGLASFPSNSKTEFGFFCSLLPSRTTLYYFNRYLTLIR